MSGANIIVATAIAILTLAVGVYYHEQVHVKAYEYLGYRNTTVSYGLSGGTATNYDDVAEEDRHYIYLANITNEAITYNLLMPMLCILMLLAMISFEVIDIKRKLK